MSNSQEQSLNENVIFLPVDESNPEFLYSESEREAVERLLSAGPEAFYSSIGTEQSGCFLSPEEVSQISSWAQYYHSSLPPGQQQNGVDGSTDAEEDFCSTYFPCQTDMPTPNLELGWPEKDPWVLKGSVTVHTSPPGEGEPPVREIIRRHLQSASQVIAIVADRLTDSAIIGDLHSVASRGVPIYIILNQRSIQENFTLNRLRHPNMRVRVLGGKSFCARTGRMVIGEMKSKFLLIDLETVIHGSYSLTWTDAHLHRQLITVLSGPPVDSFDREFRILFAASVPVSDTWSATRNHASVSHQLKDFSDYRFHKQLSLESDISIPPSPPTDILLDWEAMGVVQRDDSLPESAFAQHEEIPMQETYLQNNRLFGVNMPMNDRFINNENQYLDRNRIYENSSPITSGVIDRLPPFKKTEPYSTELTAADRMKKIERNIEMAVMRQLSNEKNSNVYDRNPSRYEKQGREPTNIHPFVNTRPKKDSILEEESITDNIGLNIESPPSSRKPVVVRMPHSESFSSLSDIMRRLQKKSPGTTNRAPKSDRTQSMLDLSVHEKETNNEERGNPVPRFKGGFDPDPMTPAFALMKKRNDDVKASFYRTPKNFLPRERPRSSSYGLRTDWRRSLTEREEDLG